MGLPRTCHSPYRSSDYSISNPAGDTAFLVVQNGGPRTIREICSPLKTQSPPFAEQNGCRSFQLYIALGK